MLCKVNDHLKKSLLKILIVNFKKKKANNKKKSNKSNKKGEMCCMLRLHSNAYYIQFNIIKLAPI